MYLRRVIFLVALVSCQFLSLSSKSNAVVIGALDITSLGNAGKVNGCASMCGQLIAGSALIGAGAWGISLFGTCGGGTFCCQTCACCTYGCLSTTAKGPDLLRDMNEEHIQDRIFEVISRSNPIFKNLPDQVINELRINAIFVAVEGLNGHDENVKILDGNKLEITMEKDFVQRLLAKGEMLKEEEKNKILVTLCESTSFQEQDFPSVYL